MSFIRYHKNIRYSLLIIAVIGMSLCSQRSQAQEYSTGLINAVRPFQTISFPDYYQIQQSRLSNKKWFVSRYTAISAGSVFYPGGNALYISAPVGLQLNRQLSKNFYAFGGLYVAPTFASFGNSFLNTSNNKLYGAFSNPYYQFGVNPGIQMGVMYVNDAGTFSISGSIRTERSGYIVQPATRNNTRK